MDIKQLQAFVEVVRLSSFTKAADRLCLTQPTISAQICRLEAELDTELIRRTTKSLQVTAAGQELYEYALNILSLTDKINERCRSAGEKIIHIGTSTIPSEYILPGLISTYRRIRPEVSFSIHQSDSEDITQGLIEGRYDIGFIGSNCPESSISSAFIGSDEMVIIAPDSEPFRTIWNSLYASGAKNKKTSSDNRMGLDKDTLLKLVSYPIILRESGSGSGKAGLGVLSEYGISESGLNVAIRTNNTASIVELVRSGAGIAIVSHFAANDGLLVFPFGKSFARRDFYMLKSKDHSLPEYANDFWNTVI